jgi:hypothetical protein
VGPPSSSRRRLSSRPFGAACSIHILHSQLDSMQGPMLPVPLKYRSPSIPRPAMSVASSSSSITNDALLAIWIWSKRPDQLIVSHPVHGRPPVRVRRPIRSHVGADQSARRADHPRAQWPQRHFVRQPIGIHDGAVVAPGGFAIDKKAATAVRSDMTERDGLEGVAMKWRYSDSLPPSRRQHSATFARRVLIPPPAVMASGRPQARPPQSRRSSCAP